MDSEQIEVRNRVPQLKRLGFVRLIAINALVCVSNLYNYTKQHSGPFKSAVGAVESAVTTIAGPVYDKFQDVPLNLLLYIDEKADDLVAKIDEHAPRSAKRIVIKTRSAIQNLIALRQVQVRSRSTDINRTSSYSCLQKLLRVLGTIWYVINKHFTSVHVLAQMALPSMARWSAKYNETVVNLSAKGYIGVRYIPKVPVENIAKAYEQIEAEKGPACSVCSEDAKLHMD